MITRPRTSWPQPSPRAAAIGMLFLSFMAQALGGAARLARADLVAVCPEFWIVHTRACPQVLGTDPWPCLEAYELDGQGVLDRRDPGLLLMKAANRPVFVVVHGSFFKAEDTVNDGLRIFGSLLAECALPPDAIVVMFDWPSERIYPHPVRDGNEKGRRSFVAGYHLARFLQAFPPGARVGLLGHSNGALAVMGALHLLGGGVLDDGENAVALPCSSVGPAGWPPPIRIRAVLIAPASDRHWLVPGERFDRALLVCEAMLCLYNCLDPVLVAAPFGRYSDRRSPLGRTGLSDRDEARLGPLMDRYCERNIAGLLGPRHTFKGTVAIPQVARWIAPYAWTTDALECP